MVGTLLGRAEVLGLTADTDLFDLYRQIDAGRFAENLTGDFMVPLVLTTFEATEAVHLVDDYWLEPLTEDVHRSRAPSTHSYDASPHIAAAATHAVVRRAATFINSDGPLSDGRMRPDTSEVRAFTNRVLEALHIVTGKHSGYAQVLVRSSEWVSWRGWVSNLPHSYATDVLVGYPVTFDRGWLRPMDPISNDDLDTTRTVLAALLNAPKNVQLASRRCLRTTFRDDIEDEILDATIGIEALLSQGRDELTHRMSLRAAAALAKDYRSDAIYNLVKQVYSQRSQIVHGGTPKNTKVKFEDGEFWTHHIGVLLLRELLRSRLTADVPWTAESLDVLILERLGHTEDSSPADDDA
jgi:hypothetical protein